MATNTALAAYRAGERASRSKPRAYHKAKPHISLAIVSGLATQVAPAIGAAFANDWKLAGYYMTYNFTGYDNQTKAWDPKALIRNWTPTLIGGLVHYGANKLGINRMIRKYIPFVEV